MSQIIVLNTDGVVIAAEQFDSTNDGKRDARIVCAIQKNQSEIGGDSPKILKSMDYEDADGRLWFRSSGNDIQVGMVEKSIGKYGF